MPEVVLAHDHLVKVGGAERVRRDAHLADSVG
ncbi:hypothetical protein QFZ29_003363 [Agromyces albus]|nr:hypothetical protein [Agromyces albus]